ncbi:hypothetical protein [Paenibacillus taichungensis]
MADLQRIKEINEEALKLDAQLKELRLKLSNEISDDFKNSDSETLTLIAQSINAECLSYYRYRIYSQIEKK